MHAFQLSDQGLCTPVNEISLPVLDRFCSVQGVGNRPGQTKGQVMASFNLTLTEKETISAYVTFGEYTDSVSFVFGTDMVLLTNIRSENSRSLVEQMITALTNGLVEAGERKAQRATEALEA